MLLSFAHEIKNLIARLDTGAKKAEKLLSSVPPKSKQDLIQFAASLRETRDRFDQQFKLFKVLADVSSETKRSAVEVKDAVREVSSGFEYLIKKYNLTEVNTEEIDPHLRTQPMIKAEFYSVVINLFSNAINAVLAGHGNTINVNS